MRCENPECSNTKPTTFIRRLISDDDGVVRENKWYCCAACHKALVLSEFISRKRNGRELRSSTHPVTSRSFGAALLRMGKIDWLQLEDALEAKRHHGGMPLAHYLLQRGLISRRDIIDALGRHHRVAVATVGDVELGPELIRMIPASLARLSGVVPISFDSDSRKLNLLMKDPSDLTTLLTVRRLLDCNVRAFQGDPAEIKRLLLRYYSEETASRVEVAPEASERLALTY